MHWNPCCNSWHLWRHYLRCWLPHEMKSITCISFNHIQLQLLTSQHCAYQRWHSHLSWCCHWRLTVNEFKTPILHNSKICYLRCNLSQRKELSQLTPINQFLPLTIEIFDCLHKHVDVFLHDCANVIWSLKGWEGPHLFTLVTFVCKKILIALQKIQAFFILSWVIVISLTTS